MKKKIVIWMLAAMCLITACGDRTEDGNIDSVAQPIDYSISVLTGDEDPVDVTTDEGIITERTEVNGLMQSYLTGQWKDAKVVQRRPMAVMIGNNKASLPQYGIGSASVIYEAPMESGSVTRLMAVLEDYDNLEYLCPIRSSRLYFLIESLSHDAIYCNWGLAIPYVGPLINSDVVDNVSQALAGIDVPAPEAFSRSQERLDDGYVMEYSGIMTISGYNNAVKRLGYAAEYDTSFKLPFQFAADGYVADYAGCESAVELYPGGEQKGKANGYGEVVPYFVYNEEDHLYYRYQNGGAHVDAFDNKQLTVTNVIFKYVEGVVLDSQGYLAFGVHGTGDIKLFTNGKVVDGTWYHSDNDKDSIYYYDTDGNELVLNQGKTWICLIWNKYRDDVVIR